MKSNLCAVHTARSLLAGRDEKRLAYLIIVMQPEMVLQPAINSIIK